MIYFVRAGETDAVKIGFAQDVQRRVKAMQGDNHEVLTIIRTAIGGRQRERWYHNYFRHRRIRHLFEWFRFDPEMLTVEPHGHLGEMARWMDECRVSQLDIQYKLGTDNRIIASWLSGDAAPSNDQAVLIASWSKGRVPVTGWAA